jgi:hypothetical protein
MSKDQDLWARLDALGEDEVRLRLAKGAYGESKLPLVQEWLRRRELPEGPTETPAPVTPVKELPAPTLYDRVLARLKNNGVVVGVLLVVALVAGLASLRKDVCSLLPQICSVGPTVSLPQIPGGSAWILIGDYDQAEQKYVRGPFYAVTQSAYRDPSPVPRKGELIRISVERNLVIPDFGATGTTRLLDPPWAEQELGPEDYVGIKLPAGAIVEVRDVSSGAKPGMPAVVWVRIAPPPS